MMFTPELELPRSNYAVMIADCNANGQGATENQIQLSRVPGLDQVYDNAYHYGGEDT
jgi:hypothetical protein